jgi:adenosine deaminase
VSGSGEGLDLNVKVNIYYENYIGSIIKKQDTVHDFLIQFPSCFFRWFRFRRISAFSVLKPNFPAQLGISQKFLTAAEFSGTLEIRNEENSMNEASALFKAALCAGDLAGLRQIPKADLHNHFMLGGDREWIAERWGVRIEAIQAPLKSMAEMDQWSQVSINTPFPDRTGRLRLLEATLRQAVKDGVSVLEIGEDVWALKHFYHGDVENLLASWKAVQEAAAPQIELRFQIGISRHCGVPYLMEKLAPFWDRPEFYSLDLYGDEQAQPIENFIPIYRRARQSGWVLKAHVGEWGSAQDVRQAVECLDLDEVQHGIAAAQDPAVMELLRQKQVRLNITPTSNRLLGRVASLADHPIAQLKRAGIPVTINSDDVLIFDSDVSKEYLRLYKAGTLTAEELDEIRQEGLK